MRLSIFVEIHTEMVNDSGATMNNTLQYLAFWVDLSISI